MIFNGKRGELEIIYELLNLAEGGSRKTPLMYRANLSYNHFMSYINFLLEHGFLSLDSDESSLENIYCTTEKGKHLLGDIQNILNQMKD